GTVHIGEEATLVSDHAFAVVVAGRAFPIEAFADPRQAAHFLHISLLTLDGWFERGCAAGARLGHHIRDVLRLFVQRLRYTDGDRRLGEAQEEAGGTAVGGQSMQGAKSVRPMLRQRLAAASDDVVTGPTRIGRADFETRGEDEAIEFVFAAIRDDTVFGQTFDALAIRVHQRDVRPVVRS